MIDGDITFKYLKEDLDTIIHHASTDEFMTSDQIKELIRGTEVLLSELNTLLDSKK